MYGSFSAATSALAKIRRGNGLNCPNVLSNYVFGHNVYLNYSVNASGKLQSKTIGRFLHNATRIATSLACSKSNKLILSIIIVQYF